MKKKLARATKKTKETTTINPLFKHTRKKNTSKIKLKGGANPTSNHPETPKEPGSSRSRETEKIIPIAKTTSENSIVYNKIEARKEANSNNTNGKIVSNSPKNPEQLHSSKPEKTTEHPELAKTKSQLLLIHDNTETHNTNKSKKKGGFFSKSYKKKRKKKDILDYLSISSIQTCKNFPEKIKRKVDQLKNKNLYDENKTYYSILAPFEKQNLIDTLESKEILNCLNSNATSILHEELEYAFHEYCLASINAIKFKPHKRIHTCSPLFISLTGSKINLFTPTQKNFTPWQTNFSFNLKLTINYIGAIQKEIHSKDDKNPIPNTITLKKNPLSLLSNALISAIDKNSTSSLIYLSNNLFILSKYFLSLRSLNSVQVLSFFYKFFDEMIDDKKLRNKILDECKKRKIEKESNIEKIPGIIEKITEYIFFVQKYEFNENCAFAIFKLNQLLAEQNDIGNDLEKLQDKTSQFILKKLKSKQYIKSPESILQIAKKCMDLFLEFERQKSTMLNIADLGINKLYLQGIGIFQHNLEKIAKDLIRGKYPTNWEGSTQPKNLAKQLLKSNLSEKSEFKNGNYTVIVETATKGTVAFITKEQKNIEMNHVEIQHLIEEAKETFHAKKDSHTLQFDKNLTFKNYEEMYYKQQEEKALAISSKKNRKLNNLTFTIKTTENLGEGLARLKANNQIDKNKTYYGVLTYFAEQHSIQEKLNINNILECINKNMTAELHNNLESAFQDYCMASSSNTLRFEPHRGLDASPPLLMCLRGNTVGLYMPEVCDFTLSKTDFVFKLILSIVHEGKNSENLHEMSDKKLVKYNLQLKKNPFPLYCQALAGEFQKGSLDAHKFLVKNLFILSKDFLLLNTSYNEKFISFFYKIVNEKIKDKNLRKIILNECKKTRLGKKSNKKKVFNIIKQISEKQSNYKDHCALIGYELVQWLENNISIGKDAKELQKKACQFILTRIEKKQNIKSPRDILNIAKSCMNLFFEYEKQKSPSCDMSSLGIDEIFVDKLARDQKILQQLTKDLVMGKNLTRWNINKQKKHPNRLSLKPTFFTEPGSKNPVRKRPPGKQKNKSFLSNSYIEGQQNIKLNNSQITKLIKKAQKAYAPKKGIETMNYESVSSCSPGN